MEQESNIKTFFDRLAPERDRWKNRNRYYYDYIEKKLIPFLVPQGKIVLEVGCGTGDLIVNLKPSVGYGTDISPEVIKLAIQKHNQPEIKFIIAENNNININEKLDYIVLSDVIGYVEDVEDLLRQLEHVTNDRSRVIITQYNQLWEPLLTFGSRIGIRMKSPIQNWLSSHYI